MYSIFVYNMNGTPKQLLKINPRAVAQTRKPIITAHLL